VILCHATAPSSRDPAPDARRDRATDPSVRQASQAMSWPQHIGDLILPSHFGHFEICTVEPSSVVIVSFTSGSLQSAQVAFTPMPQTLQR
jgi:hypothetical protein